MAQFSKAVATLILFASTMAAQHRTPQVRYKIEPSYTKQARKAKIQGLVALRCTVGKDGIPKDKYHASTFRYTAARPGYSRGNIQPDHTSGGNHYRQTGFQNCRESGARPAWT